jgi:CBS domain-containing protein
MAAKLDGISVRDVMQRGVVAVSGSTKISNAAKLLSKSGVTLMPVIEKNRLVGMVCEADIKDQADADAPVSSIMRPPVYCTVDEPLGNVVKMAINSGLPRIPVVDNDADMRCLGLVSASDMASRIKKDTENRDK